MIEELRIRDLGVIADATLPLHPGLNVLTGETGAGKTMVVTALGLLLGTRADPGVVRAGATAAVVDGLLRVRPGAESGRLATEAGGELDEDGLLLSRSVPADGRARAWVGGRPVPVSVLGAVTEQEVTVHGQSDQLRLRSTTHQRELLDAFAGPEHLVLLDGYRVAWATRRRLREELQVLEAQSRERAQEAQMLRLALGEYDRVAPRDGEDDELREEWERLAHADELQRAAVEALEAVAGDDEGTTPGAQGLLAAARAALAAVREHDPAAAELADRVAELSYLTTDLGTDLAGYASGVDADPSRLADVDARRADLAPLLRSHGDLASAETWATRSRSRLDELEDDGLPQRLREQVRAADSALEDLADRVHASRAAAADRLGGQVTTELAQLALGRARLTVDVSRTEAGPDGADDVTFLLAAHSGAEPRPLARSASGGELSRVMLAVEVVTTAEQPVGTYVFDEVDSGVGGEAAVEIGRRLGRLADGGQVVVVTHLPQVAAFADSHLVVRKADDGTGTVSDVRAVVGEDRVVEVARMLAGLGSSGTAAAHARELLGTAAQMRADGREAGGGGVAAVRGASGGAADGTVGTGGTAGGSPSRGTRRRGGPSARQPEVRAPA
ncbi:DNA repair protein RecN [Aquipuribacter hungaricus]|uniref:DNA repair protein RecN n=1 Tax=Aquipuribacter hungaricus TaxID=545624 RepID=A0ABV7WC21_9MICO